MEDLSAELKARRETSGLSVHDLFERTRINPTFLEALESGNFDILPEAYTRLFLKTYAEEIGLNAQKILARYEALKQSPKGPGPAPQVFSQIPSAGLMLAISLVLVLAAVGIGTLALKDREHSASQGVAPGEDVRITFQSPSTLAPSSTPQTPQVEASAGSDKSGTTSTSEAEPPGVPDARQISQNPSHGDLSPTVPLAEEAAALPVERIAAAYSLSTGFPFGIMDSILTLSGYALKTTRVIVSADGEQIFDGALSAGRKRLWNARSRFRIEVEKAPGVTLSLQGHALKSLGSPGRKLRLFISRSSIWVEEIAPPSGTPGGF